ncbi:MAG: hypothetical protein WCI57_04805 [Candidatus Berkelbacteria bacterium]
MKRIAKISSYILIALFFAISLSGCTKKATVATSNKLIVWSFEDEDVWKKISTNFTGVYKDMTIEYKKETLDSGYENRVLNAILSGNGPDVWAMPNDWVYRHQDKLAPMTDTVSALVNLDDLFIPAVKESVVVNNQTLGLPAGGEPLIIYYNPKIFEQAAEAYATNNPGDENKEKRDQASLLLSNFPRTWAEFSETTKILTIKDASGNVTLSGAALGTSNVANAADILYLMMMQNNTQIISPDLKLATFALPQDTPKQTSDVPGKRALELYTSFADPTSENYSWNDSMGSDVEAFVNGKTAMIFGYSQLSNYFAQKYPNFKDYKRAFVPQLSEELGTYVDYAKFNVFGVSAYSSNSRYGWQLVRLLSTDYSGDIDDASKISSVMKSTVYDVKTTSLNDRGGNNPDPLELATAKTFIKGRFPDEFDTNILSAITAVNKKELTAQAGLDLASRNITEILRRVGW